MKALSLVTELMVDDMATMLEFYCKKLDFVETVTVPDKSTPFFVILTNNKIQVMLYSRDQFSDEIPHFKDTPTGGSIALFLEVDDILKLYEDLNDSVEIIQTLHESNYGTKEFSVRDPSGYVVMFNQHI